jgi:hypothetical protein
MAPFLGICCLRAETQVPCRNGKYTDCVFCEREGTRNDWRRYSAAMWNQLRDVRVLQILPFFIRATSLAPSSVMREQVMTSPMVAGHPSEIARRYKSRRSANPPSIACFTTLSGSSTSFHRRTAPGS